MSKNEIVLSNDEIRQAIIDYMYGKIPDGEYELAWRINLSKEPDGLELSITKMEGSK